MIVTSDELYKLMENHCICMHSCDSCEYNISCEFECKIIKIQRILKGNV